VYAVTLHLLPETRHLMSQAITRSRRPGSFLVSTSRGLLVDREALAAVLRDEHLAGAAVDVYEPEPRALDGPLLDTPNAVLTPRLAWHWVDAEDQGRPHALEAVLALIVGREPADSRVAVRA
jgi:phosphoglycerate dehydrogenase-like enzyme